MVGQGGQGAPSKYDKHFHPVRAKEILEQGESLAQVCAEFVIAKSTLRDWQEVHPELKEACAIGLTLGQAMWESWLEERIKDAKPFNEGALLKLLKARYRWDPSRLHEMELLIQGAHKENVAKVMKAAKKSDLNPAEITAALAIIKTDAEIEQATELRQDVEMLKQVHAKGK